jgi:peptidoglycan hydrolase CwlO-like protein
MDRFPNFRLTLRPLLPLIAIGALMLGGSASASLSSGQLESKIGSANARNGELSSGIQADDRKIDGFQGSIDDLQARLSALQSTLGVERNLLKSLESQLGSARSRLATLKVQLARDKQVLIAQVVASYESPPPDIATVVLESHGFADMIERVEDLRSIARENAKATTNAQSEQRAVTAQAKRLTTLQTSQRSETEDVLVQRDEVAQLHLDLVNHQLQYIHARDQKSSELSTLNAHRHALEQELSKLAVSELADRGVAYAYTGPVGNETSAPDGEYGFFQAAGTNYSVGVEPILVERLNTLGIALHLHLIGISGYRTPQHSVEVGGFANDPHTRGEASDTPGVEAVPEATLERFGLTRPFPGPAEADHIQLLGSPL